MSSLALIKDDRYLEHDPGDGHPESPDRLRVIHGLIDREFSGLPLIPPRLATQSELALVHDPSYIQAVANTLDGHTPSSIPIPVFPRGHMRSPASRPAACSTV